MAGNWTDSYSKFSHLDSDDELDDAASSSGGSRQGRTAGAPGGSNDKAIIGGSGGVAKAFAAPSCFDWGSGAAVLPNDAFAFRLDPDWAKQHARVKALPQVFFFTS
jgi:hypothetical protein